jgi:hypothetical protein
MLIAMRKTLIIPAVIIGLLVSCHPEENPEQLKKVNQSLEYANGVMQDVNNLVYLGFAQLEKDPTTANVGVVWKTKVTQIRQYADSIKALINDIKIELIKQSDSLKIDYVDVTKKMHSTDGVGFRLLNKLMAFKDSIPVIIANRPYIDKSTSQLLQNVPLLSGYGGNFIADQKSNYGKKWLEESFGHTSSLMAMIMLNKIESDVLTTEKTFIDYCNSNIAVDLVIYDKYNAMAVLSSTCAKAGQSIELTVGMGSFTNDLNPRITIDGKEVKVGANATAVYKFIATGVPGEHVIPVTIEYLKPDGSKGAFGKKVMYTIAEN